MSGVFNSHTQNVRTLVLPVAGLGKRLHPLTHQIPKALLKIGDVPLVGYALREAEAAGIREVVLVISPRQEHYFKRYLSGRHAGIRELTVHIVHQAEPLGTGHAVLQAAPFLHSQSFAVRFCDDFLVGRNSPPLVQIISLFDVARAPVVLLEQVTRERLGHYGVVKIEPPPAELLRHNSRLHRIVGLIEKPDDPSFAPSNLTIVGGCILTPAIMRHLKQLAASVSNYTHDCLPLTDAIQAELSEGGDFYGLEFSGIRFDCGTPSGLKDAAKFVSEHPGVAGS